MPPPPETPGDVPVPKDVPVPAPDGASTQNVHDYWSGVQTLAGAAEQMGVALGRKTTGSEVLRELIGLFLDDPDVAGRVFERLLDHRHETAAKRSARARNPGRASRRDGGIGRSL
jgi:hypothetical protein